MADISRTGAAAAATAGAVAPVAPVSTSAASLFRSELCGRGGRGGGGEGIRDRPRGRRQDRDRPEQAGRLSGAKRGQARVRRRAHECREAAWVVVGDGGERARERGDVAGGEAPARGRGHHGRQQGGKLGRQRLRNREVIIKSGKSGPSASLQVRP